MWFKDGYGQGLDRKSVCYDPSASVVVTITDTCPCSYPGNYYSNKRWCCGDMYHSKCPFGQHSSIPHCAAWQPSYECWQSISSAVHCMVTWMLSLRIHVTSYIGDEIYTLFITKLLTLQLFCVLCFFAVDLSIWTFERWVVRLVSMPCNSSASCHASSTHSNSCALATLLLKGNLPTSDILPLLHTYTGLLPLKRV